MSQNDFILNSDSKTKFKVRDEIQEFDISGELPCSNFDDISGYSVQGFNFVPPLKAKKQGGILFLAPCAYEEEADRTLSKSPSMYLKGPAGAILQRCIINHNIKDDEYSYFSIVPHAIHRKYKLVPPAELISIYAERTWRLINELNPKIIVCLGKIPFDFVYPTRLKFNDVKGGLFKLENSNCLVYPIAHTIGLLSKPELLTALVADMKEIKRIYDASEFSKIYDDSELNYQVLDTVDKLRAFVDSLLVELKSDPINIISVDCEWGGANFIDGTLRYVQLCWKPFNAACVVITSEGLTPVLLNHMDEVKFHLGRLLNRNKVMFIGHNISADAVWLKHHLDIDLYRRCVFDTMYAQHTIDEYGDLKLERLSLMYTNMGRYDIELILYKKKHKLSADSGYENIPDKILIPYSMKDVDAVYRIYKQQRDRMEYEGSLDYYYNIKLPFVTDGFYIMTYNGIPCSIELIDEMSDQYTFVKNMMNVVFLKLMEEESVDLVVERIKENNLKLPVPESFYKHYVMGSRFNEEYQNTIKSLFRNKSIKPENRKRLHDTYIHFLNVFEFNYSSDKDMRFYLFDVKGYMPLYSTKVDGVNVAWDKVLKLNNPSLIANYTPSSDKNTIKFYAEQGDIVLLKLGMLKAVNTIIRTFLREDKQGLYKYVSKDGFVHCNYALTKTNRPRTWNPNILNLTSYVSGNIEKAVASVKEYCRNLQDLGELEDFKAKYEKETNRRFYSIDELDRIKPVRYCFESKPGYCIVGSDYKTAEIVALAFISKDKNMIKAVTEQDTQYALLQDPEHPEKPPKPVRISYNENSSVSKENEDKKLLVDTNNPNLLRDASNNLIHPRRDLHWEFVESASFMGKPREILDKDKHRSQGKIGNFSIPYGGRASYLESKIEIETGIKPAEGTGDKILNTYSVKYPEASEYLLDRERDVTSPNRRYFKSISGAIRHYNIHEEGAVSGLNERVRLSTVSSLQREARNAPIQGIVADTLARAVVNFNAFCIDNGYKSRAIIPLYDALYVYCPLEERFLVLEWLDRFMAKENTWDVDGNKLEFEIDGEMYFNWSVYPDSENKKLLEDKTKLTFKKL